MKKLLCYNLVNHTEEITDNLEERIRKILPEEYHNQARNFAQQIITALNLYFIDNDTQTAVRHLETVTKKLFPQLKDALKLTVDALAISRYILLAVITRYSSKPINSLETFSFLNDNFDPLLRALYQHYKSPPQSLHDLFPEDIARATELGLLVVDFAGIGLFMLDQNLNFIYWSRGMERMYNVPASEVLGQPLPDKFPALVKEKAFFKAINKAREQGEEFELYGFEHETLPKGKRVLNLKIAPLKSKQNQVIGVSVLVHDVTERKQKELALKKYEQYFANILNDAADAIIILDEQDRIVMWNKAAEALYGWSKEEVIGKSITLIVPDDEKSIEEIKWISQQVREKGYIRKFRTHRRTRTGREVIIEITRTAIKNEKGEYIGSSVISRDVTQEEKLQEQLIHSEKLSAVGTLAAGIAHEVGSPLTAISSIIQLLKLKSTDDYFKEKMSLIQQQIDRISRTVRTLVDFSKPIAQKIENIYLNAVVEQVIRIIKYDKRLKYLEITTELQPDLPVIKASFDQLLQVFINICLNAADAMEGKKDGHLIIRTWSDDDNVYASITDNGCGIPKENLSRIFEPFFTTKDESKGTGLGLWVSYNIIKSFSGNIAVESKVGQGTTFKISIPIAKKD